jgi:hypothetical protein
MPRLISPAGYSQCLQLEEALGLEVVGVKQLHHVALVAMKLV